jgi:2'-5' RNA ligase
MTTILTLRLDQASQAHLESLRQQHYPKHLNQIPAHLTLFHQLPPLEEIEATLQHAAHRSPFPVEVTGLRSLGRGVAFTLASAELQRLHAELSQPFEGYLTAQDRQKFQPHIVVQNKATPEAARTLLAQLRAEFRPFPVQAVGLVLWHYLGGPWELAQSFCFHLVP